ncbi:chitin synthase-domain-containing protein [Catenaria anguillulae PL171]|uniref:Chitin synthase n=1 Tax=Catenaria anguillulae PL171 TaxID=765915 RepID=A0A1Y2HUR7_9FUNG|nr:chitin synthase-domain-containing protein [Catenaria anguillulae PL171]
MSYTPVGQQPSGPYPPQQQQQHPGGAYAMAPMPVPAPQHTGGAMLMPEPGALYAQQPVSPNYTGYSHTHTDTTGTSAYTLAEPQPASLLPHANDQSFAQGQGPTAAAAGASSEVDEKVPALTLRAQQGQPNPVTIGVPGELFKDPSRPNSFGPPQGSPEEAKYLRYTAAVGEPEEYPEWIRQKGGMMHAKNEIRLMIVVTMYSEDPRLFTKTMRAVHDNIRDILHSNDPAWQSPDAWKHILVVIVSDGRTKIHPGVITLLSMMGGYRDGLMRKTWEGQDVSAHIFESTVIRNFDGKVDKGVTIVDNFTSLERSIVPMQLIFCLKEKNAKKINSHRWFFKAFCEAIQPKVTVLIDVGTQPLPNSIYRLSKMFDNPQVAGACGEIAVEGSKRYKLNPIIAAQNFEYKMSNILDKPVEALAGYITVLPGAFSAYRFKALQGRPLDAYFKGEVVEKDGGLFERNMYLAEDRILCFELVTRSDGNYVLDYDKKSVAVTDAPDDFAELIPQRRRWLNGSTFALLYALMNFSRIFSSGHSFGRKIIMFFEFVYLLLNFLFGFVSLGHFYFAFHFLIRGFLELMQKNADAYVAYMAEIARNPSLASTLKKPFFTFIPYYEPGFFFKLIDVLCNLSRPIFVLLIILTFIASLGNSPKSSRGIFLGIIYSFAMLSAATFIIIMLTTTAQMQRAGFSLFPLRFSSPDSNTKDSTEAVWTLLALMSTWGLYIASSFLYGDYYHPIANMIQYTLLVPTWTIVLQVFAYCNVSETWGTKGSDEVHFIKVGAKPTIPMRDGIPERDLITMPYESDADYVKDRGTEWASLRELMTKEPDAPKPVYSQPDVFKAFRTWFLLFWILVNGALLYILLVPQGLGIPLDFPGKYFNVLFFIVLGLSAFRFVFSTLYLIKNRRR